MDGFGRCKDDSICGFEGMESLRGKKRRIGRNARVAQWWSIALPRRGSRVRIPSRAFKISFKLTANADMKRVCGFYFFLIYGWNYLYINPGVLQNENGIFCPASEIIRLRLLS